MAELGLPHAGYTASNRFNEISVYTLTLDGLSNGHTPPTGWPVYVETSSKESILGLNPKVFLNFELFTLPSPAVTINMHPSSSLNDKDLAILAGSVDKASAANSTVAQCRELK